MEADKVDRVNVLRPTRHRIPWVISETFLPATASLVASCEEKKQDGSDAQNVPTNVQMGVTKMVAIITMRDDDDDDDDYYYYILYYCYYIQGR